MIKLIWFLTFILEYRPHPCPPSLIIKLEWGPFVGLGRVVWITRKWGELCIVWCHLREAICICSSLIQRNEASLPIDSLLRVSECKSWPLRNINAPGKGRTHVKSLSVFHPSELPHLRTFSRGTSTAWDTFLKAQNSLEAYKGMDQEAEVLKSYDSSWDHLWSRIVKIWKE